MDWSDIGNGLADMGSSILHGAGTILDTPRRMLYGAGNAVAHGLGYQGPDVNHFSDLLTKLGMDPEGTATHVLGFMGDMATDPLTYAGGAAARFARGLLPGNGAVSLGRAAEAGEGLANQAFRNELQGVTKFRDAQFVPSAFVNGNDGAIMRDGGRVLGLSEPTLGNGQRLTAEIARGRNLPEEVLKQKLSDMGNLAEMGGSSAFFSPRQQAQLTVPGEAWVGSEGLAGGANEASRLASRHEAVHGIIDNARRMGTAGDLPLAMRIPASLPATYDATASGASKALGLMTNELAAHSLERRGLGNQLVGGANFLFSPAKNAEYVDQISHLSPLIGKLYGYAPSAMVDAGYGLGGGIGATGRGLAGQ